MSFARIFKVLAVCTLIGACIYLFFILSDDALYEYEKFDEPIISNNLEIITPLKTQSELQPITLEQAIKSRDSVLRHQEIMGLVSVDSMLTLHEVGSGETLALIALKYYGKTIYWKEIVDFNKEIITNPDFLPEGLKIRITILNIQ